MIVKKTLYFATSIVGQSRSATADNYIEGELTTHYNSFNIFASWV